MLAGNRNYLGDKDIPEIVPVFPLSGALLLPGGQMPLNIFEPRYVAMIDHVLAGNRLIAMVQSTIGDNLSANPGPNHGLCEIGCLGRLTAFQETGDGRYLINLGGVCRYRIVEEVVGNLPFRQIRIAPFVEELLGADDGAGVDRGELLDTLRKYLKANQLQMDWDSVERADNVTLVTALSMMCPYGPAEKQALLEAPDVKSRAQTLVALTEIALARDANSSTSTLQ